MLGRPIGMTVFGPRRRVLVIPAATIERVAPRLEAHGRIPLDKSCPAMATGLTGSVVR